MENQRAPSARRGRPRAGERVERERRVLDAALEELIEHGYEGVTMLGVASRAGASKETLYNWFGGKEALFGELIKRNADASAEQVDAAFETNAPPREVLVAYATGLLTLLTTPGSIALNRAAMSTPELAGVLLTNGRHRVGPIVERYFARLARDRVILEVDPADAFELFYGLVVRDTQIRVLLGESPPVDEERARRSSAAVDQFFELVGARDEAGLSRPGTPTSTS